MPSRDPVQRTLIAREAALIGLALCEDRTARTEPAKRAFLDSFEKKVPESVTDPVERARRAEFLRRAHMTKLARASAKARRQKKDARAAAKAADRQLAEALERDGGDAA